MFKYCLKHLKNEKRKKQIQFIKTKTNKNIGTKIKNKKVKL